MNARDRVGRIVVGVLGQALADSGAAVLVLLDDMSPQGKLAADWCAQAAGERFVDMAPPSRGTASVELRPRGSPPPPLSDDERAARRAMPGDEVIAEESQRWAARLHADRNPGGALFAHPANKTALLLSTDPPPEPLLPLGDLYATDVRDLAGGFSLPGPLRDLAELAGGIDALDAALRAHFDERRRLEEALAPLPEAARAPVASALAAARFARRRVGLVPKLGACTLGVDLFT